MKSQNSSLKLAAVIIASLLLGLLLANPLISLWEKWRGDPDASAAEDGEVQWYISGMHPWIIQPGPGLCPVCGMELTPLSPEMLTGELAIDPLIVQNIGVRTAEVTREPLVMAVFTVGTVEFDETLQREVVLRAPGYLEKLMVRYEGQAVEEGDIIAEVHSPAIMAALDELHALNRRGSDPNTITAIRHRLRVLGLGPDQIRALEEAGQSPWSIPLRSPLRGIVTRIRASEGSQIGEGETLVEISPIDRVWAIAALYESQISRIRPGATVRVRDTLQPGRIIEGSIDYLYPTLDPQTRQGRARLVFDNTDGSLMPGMFLRLEIDDTSTQAVLQVPREAVLDTGQRQIAYVSLGDGRFEPREVRAGRESESGRLEILSGLQAGERVVVSGQFLLDSEARLRESLLKLVTGETASGQAVQAPMEARPDIDSLPPDFARSLAEIIEAYLRITAPLIEDQLAGVAAAARSLGDAAGSAVGASESFPAEQQQDMRLRAAAIAEAADRLAGATTIIEARLALRDLSDRLREILHRTGIPAGVDGELHEVRCPMFPELGDHAWWFQRATPTANPYMGQSMLSCQDRRFALPGADREPTQPETDDEPAVPHHSAAETGGVQDLARGHLTSFDAVVLRGAEPAALAEALKAYLSIGEHLLRDSLENAEQQGNFLHAALSRLPQLDRAQRAARNLAQTRTLDTARMSFAILGEELIGYMHAAGLPPDFGEDDLMAARCHMYPAFGEYGWWIQRAGDLRNPLWGPAMLKCADIFRPIMERDEEVKNGGHDHD